MWGASSRLVVAAVLTCCIGSFMSGRAPADIVDLPPIWAVIWIVVSTCANVFLLVVYRDCLQRLGSAIWPVRRTSAQGSREAGKTSLVSGFQLGSLSGEPGICARCGGDPSGYSDKYCTGCQNVVPHYPIPGLASPRARWTYRLVVASEERPRELQVRLRDIANQIKSHFGMMRDSPLNPTVLYLKVIDVHIWCESGDCPTAECGRDPTIKCGVHGLDEDNERYKTLYRSADFRSTAKCGYILPSCDRALVLDTAKTDPIIATLWIPRGRSVECRINTIWFCMKRPVPDGQEAVNLSPECQALLPPSSSASNVVFTDRTADVEGGTKEFDTDLDSHPVFLAKRLVGKVLNIRTGHTDDGSVPNSGPRTTPALVESNCSSAVSEEELPGVHDNLLGEAAFDDGSVDKSRP